MDSVMLLRSPPSSLHPPLSSQPMLLAGLILVLRYCTVLTGLIPQARVGGVKSFLTSRFCVASRSQAEGLDLWGVLDCFCGPLIRSWRGASSAFIDEGMERHLPGLLALLGCSSPLRVSSPLPAFGCLLPALSLSLCLGSDRDRPQPSQPTAHSLSTQSTQFTLTETYHFLTKQYRVYTHSSAFSPSA
jgi:hypothetical protein